MWALPFSPRASPRAGTPAAFNVLMTLTLLLPLANASGKKKLPGLGSCLMGKVVE